MRPATVWRKRPGGSRKRRCLSHWGAWFAAAAASLLVVLPNVSASAAEALEQVPVLGPLVQVVTLRNYLYDDGHSFANVSVPQVQEGGQAGSSVNAAVQADIDRLLDQFRRDAEVLAQGGYQSLDVSYEVTADTGPLVHPLRVRPSNPGQRTSDPALLSA